MAEKNYTEYERELRDFEKKPLAKDRETLIFPPESDTKGSDDQDPSVLPVAPKLSMRKEAIPKKGEDLSLAEKVKLINQHREEILQTRAEDRAEEENLDSDEAYDIVATEFDEELSDEEKVDLFWDIVATASKKISINDKILTSTKKTARIVAISDDIVFWVSIDGEKDFGSDFVEDIEPFEEHEPFERHRRERGHEPVDEGIVKEIPMEETLELTSKNKKMFSNFSKRKKKAGTWSLPFTPAAATTLESIVSRLKDSDISTHEAAEELYGAFGDDELFDDLLELEKSISLRAAEVISGHVRQLLDKYKTNPEDFREELDPEAEKILERI